MANKKIIITKNQFKKLKEVFESDNFIDHVVWEEDNSNGIGPVVKLSHGKNIQIDITDVDSW